jgi:hypothetical protein
MKLFSKLSKLAVILAVVFFASSAFANTLVVMEAGSLAKPFKAIEEAFNKRRRAFWAVSPTQVAVRSSLLARLRRWNPTSRVRRVPPRKGSIPGQRWPGFCFFRRTQGWSQRGFLQSPELPPRPASLPLVREQSLSSLQLVTKPLLSFSSLP